MGSIVLFALLAGNAAAAPARTLSPDETLTAIRNVLEANPATAELGGRAHLRASKASSNLMRAQPETEENMTPDAYCSDLREEHMKFEKQEKEVMDSLHAVYAKALGQKEFFFEAILNMFKHIAEGEQHVEDTQQQFIDQRHFIAQKANDHKCKGLDDVDDDELQKFDTAAAPAAAGSVDHDHSYHHHGSYDDDGKGATNLVRAQEEDLTKDEYCSRLKASMDDATKEEPEVMDGIREQLKNAKTQMDEKMEEMNLLEKIHEIFSPIAKAKAKIDSMEEKFADGEKQFESKAEEHKCEKSGGKGKGV